MRIPFVLDISRPLIWRERGGYGGITALVDYDIYTGTVIVSELYKCLLAELTKLADGGANCWCDDGHGLE